MRFCVAGCVASLLAARLALCDLRDPSLPYGSRLLMSQPRPRGSPGLGLMVLKRLWSLLLLLQAINIFNGKTAGALPATGTNRGGSGAGAGAGAGRGSYAVEGVTVKAECQ